MSSRFHCTQCDYKGTRQRQLLSHIKSMHEGIQFFCDQCNFKARYMTSLSVHKQSIHKEIQERKSKKSICDICKNSYYSVKAHKLAVHELQRPYPCKFCGKAFNDKSARGRHHALHEVKEQLFKCDVCENSYSTKDYLLAHKRSHKKEYYECIKCGSKVKGKYGLKEHLKRHTTSIKCPKCDKVFNSPDFLRKHKYNIHNKKERVSCQECGSTFKAVEYLRKHMKFTHLLKDAGRWKCDDCNKVFSGQGALINHKRIHSKEGFKCDSCSYTATQKYNLKTHVKRIHVGESKDFICKACSKSFGCKVKLNMHKMRHTGVKPYVCSCGERFSENRTKKAHAKNTGCRLDSILDFSFLAFK